MCIQFWTKIVKLFSGGSRIFQPQGKALSYYFTYKRSCGKVMFLHLTVILSTGLCMPSVCWDTPPRQTSPLGSRHPPGSRHPQETDTPGKQTLPRKQTPPQRPLLRTVRILMECILVFAKNCIKIFKNWTESRAWVPRALNPPLHFLICNMAVLLFFETIIYSSTMFLDSSTISIFNQQYVTF